MSSFDTAYMINERDLNSEFANRLFYITYESASSYFLSKIFSSSGFKGFKTTNS